MSIWSYDSSITEIELVRTAARAVKCAFCRERLSSSYSWDISYAEERQYQELRRDTQRVEMRDGSTSFLVHPDRREVRTCRVCGWWVAVEHSKVYEGLRLVRTTRAAAGRLIGLDVSDQSAPLSEIRKYLAAKYGERSQVEPFRFEEVVASVYSDLGYPARVTARSGDGGIDVVLEGTNGRIGVQVKRYRGKIEVEQINSLAGALFIDGYQEGMFVTTSSFTRGARRRAEGAALRGTPIRLVDSERFFRDLGLAQRRVYSDPDDPTAPFSRAKLLDLEETPIFRKPHTL